MDPQLSLDSLNDALLDHILSFLSGDGATLPNVLLTCKRWHAAAERAAALPLLKIDDNKMNSVRGADWREWRDREEAFLRLLARKSCTSLRKCSVRLGYMLLPLLPGLLRSLNGGGLQLLHLTVLPLPPSSIPQASEVSTTVAVQATCFSAPVAPWRGELESLQLLGAGAWAADESDCPGPLNASLLRPGRASFRRQTHSGS